jgi:glycosyltransferase involved in cell wall biosynthesis
MEVDHITFSSSGGAGIVSRSLNDSMVKLGVDSQLHRLIELDLRREPLVFPGLTVRAAIDEFLVKNNSQPTQLSLFRSNSNLFEKLPVRRSSFFHLHWVEGLLRHDGIHALGEQGRKIVWTLHDMAPFTGACHHAHDCEQFTSSCRACPQACQIAQGLVARSQERKLLFRDAPSWLKVVAPSRWLANKASASAVFRDHKISVIGNPVSDAFLKTISRSEAKRRFGISESVFSCVVVASDLANPNKQVKEIVVAFEKFRKHHDGDSLLYLVGAGYKQFERNPAVRCVGLLKPGDLASLFAAVDVNLSMAKAESFGLTIAEAGFLGTPSVVLTGHGAEEVFEEGLSGFKVAETSELPQKLLELALLSQETWRNLRSGTRIHFESNSHPIKVANKYLEIYQSLSN